MYFSAGEMVYFHVDLWEFSLQDGPLHAKCFRHMLHHDADSDQFREVGSMKKSPFISQNLNNFLKKVNSNTLMDFEEQG